MQDINFIWPSESWLYGAIVIDLYSHKIFGWSINTRLKAQFDFDELIMAMWQQKTKAGLMVHSDQGVQYTSHQYRQLLGYMVLLALRIRKISTGDYTVAKSFFCHLKEKSVQFSKIY